MTETKCFKPFSRGTILLLMWSALMSFVLFSITDNLIPLFSNFNKDLNNYSIYVPAPMLALLPVAGWIGDSLLGRYRAITVAIFLSAVTHLAIIISFVMLQFDWTTTAFVVMCISLPAVAFGGALFFISSLPFVIDQMIGASADDIIAAIQWYGWAFAVGIAAQHLPICLSIVTEQQNILLIYLSLSFLSLSMVLVTDCLCHKWLDIHYKKSNPFKTIFKVLNYARKTKYPERRSAFTYIDEEEPSRLDYGKHKFGGPFTEEEVEDVKTILRLLPLFLSSFGALVANDLGYKDHFQAHIISTTDELLPCVEQLQKLILYVSVVVLIPAYRFIMLPLLHNHIPSLIKRAGTGFVLCFIGTLLDLTLDTIGHLHSNNTHCMFDTYSESANTLPIPLYWLLLSDIVYGIGAAIALATLIEFVMAQSPNSMRGVMMGVFVMLLFIATAVNYGLELLLRHFSNATPSCGFYYYLVLSILIMLSLVLFTIAAKRYKLRERERHVNIQAIVEEHHERYLDQEEEYMREAANMYKTNDDITVTSK